MEVAEVEVVGAVLVEEGWGVAAAAVAAGGTAATVPTTDGSLNQSSTCRRTQDGSP